MEKVIRLRRICPVSSRKIPGLGCRSAGHNRAMEKDDSLLRLAMLVLVCKQYPPGAADELLLMAVDDPYLFTAEVLAANASGRIRLPRAQVELLNRDLATHQVAV